MNKKTDYDMSIVTAVNKIFNINNCDVTDSRVWGAITTAAGEMSKASDEDIDIDDVADAMLSFNFINEGETCQFLNMAPQYVKATIGYDTDFRDYTSAKNEYNSQKAQYDKFYKLLELRNQELVSKAGKSK